MSIIYKASPIKEQVEFEGVPTYSKASALLATLTTPDSTLVMKLPSGIGLDFSVQENGLLWVEFYADDLYSASVTMSIAQRVLKRAFEGGKNNIKECYGDIISKWD